MVTGDSKRIIVIKNLPSNMIEEAILILKSDPDIQAGETSNKFPAKKASADRNFLVKEAEAIINNYIKENKLCAIQGKLGQNKFRFLKNKRLVNSIINIALIGSIVILLLVAVKLI